MVYSAKPKPANPHEIAMYGHVAATLRTYMDARKMTPGDFNEARGVSREHTAVYGWLKAKSAPGTKLAPQLAKLIGCRPEDLMARPYTANPSEGALVATLPSYPSGTVGRPPRVTLPSDALSFAITTQGRARVKLDVELSAKQGAALFGLLMNANQLASIIDMEPSED